ncbi:MAG: hypothetical protein EBX41_01265, partial [Chitinophagia bacterium]|nr:hypothetical protein [Chitinophagia bacterium]
KYLDKVAFNGGMYGRYTIHPALSLKFGLGFGSFYASDEWNFDLAKKAKTQGEDAYQRYARAIKSKAYIFESMLLFEFSPFRYNPESRKAHRRGQPYIGAGVGYFHFEPYSNVAMSNTFVKTFPLKIEGNGFGDSFPKSYSLWQPSIPFVVGYRWDIGEHLNLGIEYCYRKTFTDYLDGVSGKYIDPAEYSKHLSANEAANARDVQDKAIYSIYTQPHTPGQMRGNPADKDAYGSFNITFYYKVFTRTKEWWHIF